MTIGFCCAGCRFESRPSLPTAAAEATGASSLAVVDQRNRVHSSVLTEQLIDFVYGPGEGQVAAIYCQFSIPRRYSGLCRRGVSWYTHVMNM